MSFAGLGFPADLAGRRAEDLAGESLVVRMYRLVGDQLFDVPQVAGQIAPDRGVTLVLIGLGQGEELGYRQQPGSRQGVGVVLDPQAVGCMQFQRLDRRDQPLPVFSAVIYAEKAGL